MAKSRAFDIHAFVQQIRDEVHAEYQAKLARVLSIVGALVSEVESLAKASLKPPRAARARGPGAAARSKDAPKAAPRTYEGPGPGRRECPSCGKYVGVRSAKCPGCGHAFERAAKAAPSKGRRRAAAESSEVAAETT